MDNEKLGDGLDDFARELAQLVPRTGELSHAQVMFLAGQESVRAAQPLRKPRNWIWPALTFASSVAAIVFATLWATPTEPLVVEKIVYQDRVIKVPREQPVSLPHIDNSDDEESWSLRSNSKPRSVPPYLRIRQIAFEQGVEKLPRLDGNSAADTPVSYREMQRNLIGRQVDQFDSAEPSEGDNT